MNCFKKEITVPPYSELASIYDDVMAHVDYRTWAKFIHDIIRMHSNTHVNVLDVACGTGNLMLEMIHFDYQLYGSDQSYAMLRLAKKKIDALSYHVPLWISDMISIYTRTRFDVIMCLYDSFNYMLDKKYWNDFFMSMSHCLNEHGLLIFDICTEKNSIKYFNNYFEKSRGKDYNYTRKSLFDHVTGIHSNIFKINYEHTNLIYVERHNQRIYKINEIIDHLAKLPFKLLEIYDDFSFKQASENSLRAHFILEKVSSK
ncbi:class I SAM-dependent methyltransferase [candidate division KSB1 bacterium]|nr:class I SAM-dependent methyltransferase [candidate division KSB1 bacterium]